MMNLDVSLVNHRFMSYSYAENERCISCLYFKHPGNVLIVKNQTMKNSESHHRKFGTKGIAQERKIESRSRISQPKKFYFIG